MRSAASQRAAHASNLARDRYDATGRWFWVSALVGSVILAAFLAAAIPSRGWWPFLLMGVPGAIGSIGPLVGAAFNERTYAWGHVAWLLGIGFSAALTDGADSFLIPFVCIYALALFSRLGPGTAAGYAWLAFVLACIPILVWDWDGFVESPWVLASTALGLVFITLFGGQMAAGEIRHRGEATIDQLTGLLNRRGLDERLAELGQQALVIGDDTALALVASDLDHFKLINDTYGHACGDQVLRDVAYVIRKELRRFELTYRMGGEEFLIVLPGHDATTAMAVAESIRAAIEGARPGGIEVTISMGVAVCRAADLDTDALLLAADSAVYEAKAAGRNRVVLASDVGRLQSVPAAESVAGYSI